MNLDIGFTRDDKLFRYRAGGLILHDGKALFVKSNEDRYGGYYYVLGGGVELGESSMHCIEREVFEETGMKAHCERLAVVLENFFLGGGNPPDLKDCHTIEFYYIMRIEDPESCKTMTDCNEKLEWIPIEEIERFTIKPIVIAERFKEILASKEILHIIEERDRRI